MDIEEAIKYLEEHEDDFECHRYGNYGMYGLNMIGMRSTIFYKDDTWQFIYTKNNGNMAVYVNKDREILHLPMMKYSSDVTRLQIKTPHVLPDEVFIYLIELYDFFHGDKIVRRRPEITESVNAFFARYELTEELFMDIYEEVEGTRRFNLDILRNYCLCKPASDIVMA